MRRYLINGERRALELDNQGPIRFCETGQLAEDILSAYSHYGFYIFENVLSDAELENPKEDIEAMRATFPAEPKGKLSPDGRPAQGVDIKQLVAESGSERLQRAVPILRFESVRQVHRFMGTHAAVQNLFNLGRYLVRTRILPAHPDKCDRCY